MIKKLLIVSLIFVAMPCVAEMGTVEQCKQKLTQKYDELAGHPNVVQCKQKFNESGVIGYAAVGALATVIVDSIASYMISSNPKHFQNIILGAVIGTGVYAYRYSRSATLAYKRLGVLRAYNNKLSTVEDVALSKTDYKTVAKHYNELVVLPASTAATGEALKNSVTAGVQRLTGKR